MPLSWPCTDFSLVRPRPRNFCPPVCEESDAQFCRFQVASANRMMQLVHVERAEMAEARVDASRFRDEEGLVFISAVDRHIDDSHIRWSRLLKKSPKFGPTKVATGENAGPLRYQRSNGARDFIHPLNLRCLVKEFGNNLPLVISGPVVLEEDVVTAPRLGGLMLPKNTLLYGSSARLVEIDLKVVVSLESLSEFSVELWKREQKRVSQHKSIVERDEAERRLQEDHILARRLAREEVRSCGWAGGVNSVTELTFFNNLVQKIQEERRIRDFFNLSEAQQKDMRAPSPRAESPEGSFAAIVSHGGFFPALPPSAHIASASETFSLQKINGATSGPWGASPGSQKGGPVTPIAKAPTPFTLSGNASASKGLTSQSLYSSATPPSSSSPPTFASVLQNKPGKGSKLLFSNNSASRRGSG